MRSLILGTVAVLLVTACRNENAADDLVPRTSRSVTANFSPVWGGFPFKLGSAYIDGFGRQVKISRLQVYLTDFVPKADNDTVIGSDLLDAVLFDAAGSNVVPLGTVEGTHIHEIELFIGIDSLRNHADPMLALAPLNKAVMHWNWNPTAGYKFAVIEGRVDSDGNGVINSTDAIFQYHLASDALRTKVVLEPDVDMALGETYSMEVVIDVQQVFANVDVMNNLDTHTNNEPLLAAQLMSNLVKAIEVE